MPRLYRKEDGKPVNVDVDQVETMLKSKAFTKDAPEEAYVDPDMSAAQQEKFDIEGLKNDLQAANDQIETLVVQRDTANEALEAANAEIEALKEAAKPAGRGKK